MKIFKNYVWFYSILFLFLLSACGGGGESSSSNTGKLSIRLTDASSDEYAAVYVTIDNVQVHLGDVDGEGDGDNNWISVATPQKTYNLLELVNGVMEQLGVADLQPGIYTQMRIYLGLLNPDDELNLLGDPHPFPNYVIDKDDDDVHELKVPSGYQTGIKIVREFEIVAGLTVDLVLDFDAAASVVKAGNSGQYLLKPTIKVVDTVNNAILNGTVTDEQQAGLEGAAISAQIYDPNPADVKNMVSVYTSTITAGDDGGNTAGEYLMYLPPGAYQIVAYKPGFMPECRNIETSLDDELTENFVLIEAAYLGTVTCTVTIVDPDADQSALISIRQLCGNEIIEVVSLNSANGTSQDIILPEGDYTVVSSTEGRDTIESTITVAEATSPTGLNIIFP